MTKSEQIKMLHTEMRPVISRLDFKIKRYDRLLIHLHKRTDVVLDRIYNFLRSLQPLVKEIDTFLNLPFMTSDVWANYKVLFDDEVLPERVRLNHMTQDFSKRISSFYKENRHLYDKKTFRQPNQKGEVQPEGTVAPSVDGDGGHAVLPDPSN